MTTAQDDFTAPGTSAEVRLELVVTITSQDIAANSSLLAWTLRMVEYVNGSPFRNYHDCVAAASIGGVSVYSAGNLDYDFNLTNETIVIATGSRTVVHDDDGTKTVTLAASYDGKSPLGVAAASTPMVLTPIPRATLPILSDTTPDTGQSVTITLTPADSGFNHRLYWSFQNGTGGSYLDNKINGLAGGSGSAHGSVEGASADGTFGNYWEVPAGTRTPTITVPHAVFAQAVDKTSRIVTLEVETWDSGVYIGTYGQQMIVTLAASETPDFGTVTNSEAVTSPNVASLIGAYVQLISKLTLAITSATGIHGSTIVSKVVQVMSGATVLQTIDVTAGSVATPNAISASGTITLRGTVTDSRGRTKTEDVSITVLAFAPPSVSALNIRRSLSDGTLDEEGTYIRVDLTAAVQSLIVSAVQKNALTYRISTSPKNANTWTVKTTTTPGGVTFNSHVEVGTYAITDAFDVKVEVYDKLTSSAPLTLIGAQPTAGIFLHLGNAGEGLGVGMYWTQGSIDALNRIYQRNGFAVIDEDDLATELATLTAAVRLPAGFVGWTAQRAAPTGYLACDGSAVSRTTYADLFAATNESIGTVTMTIATPAVVTKTAHGLRTGQAVYLTTTGALPTGLSANTAYYVIRVDANTFNLATSLANALAGTAIATTGSQSGTHTLRTTYGVGNGSTTFNLPNIASRTIVGVDTSQVEFAAMGETGGEKEHVLTQTEMPAHVHVQKYSTHGASANDGSSLAGMTGSGGNSSGTAQQSTASTGADAAHNNLQPYVVLNPIIKT